MPIESILIAVVTLIICAAACFYMYIRQSFFEKKLLMVEGILVDVKMAMDSIMTEGVMPSPAPIAGHGRPAPAMGGAGAEGSDSIPEEAFYSSVLAAAHQEAETGVPSAAEPSAADEILATMNRVAREDAMAGAADSEPLPALVPDANLSEEAAALPSAAGAAAAPVAAGPNIEAMTKQELVSLAEQRGLRAKKTMNRTELLNLLRSNAPLPNRDSETGVENGADSRNGLFPDAAPIDGDYPVDLGQN
jgi:hypothetical protein